MSERCNNLTLIIDEFMADTFVSSSRAGVCNSVAADNYLPHISKIVIGLVERSGFIVDSSGYLFDADIFAGDLKSYLSGETWFANSQNKLRMYEAFERINKYLIVKDEIIRSPIIVGGDGKICTNSNLLISSNSNFAVSNLFSYKRRDLSAYSRVLNNVAKSGRVLRKSPGCIDTHIFMAKFKNSLDSFVVRVDRLQCKNEVISQSVLSTELKTYCDGHHFYKAIDNNEMLSICLYYIDDKTTAENINEANTISLISARDMYFGYKDVNVDKIDESIDVVFDVKSLLVDNDMHRHEGFSYRRAKEIFYGHNENWDRMSSNRWN